MKHMKNLFAALLVAVMAISMLSCMVFNVAAAQFELGGPVTIEKLPVRGSSMGTGIVTGGRLLTESKILVVNSDWDEAKGTQPIKLGGITYNVTIGVNGFADLSEALAAAKGHETIYVAAGEYSGGVQTAGNIKIYGPYAGVNPNSKTLSKANAKRPAAAGVDASTEKEAVLTGGITFTQSGSDLVVDGLYFGGSSNFGTDGTMGTGATNYRYGTLVKNCIFNSTAGKLFNFSAGNSPSVEIINNRVLSGKALVYITGLMDLRVANNYLNLKGHTVEALRVTAGSVGSYALVEDNYYEYSGGSLFSKTTEDQTAVYTAIVRNNHVADMGDAPVVGNTFFASHTLPGTNLQVSGNKIMKINPGKTVFEFPFVEDQAFPNRFNFIININENYFDIPANTMFVTSDMNGVMDLSNNYYATPISVDRVTKYEYAKAILYPYYADPAMTKLEGDAAFVAGMPNTEIDTAKKLVTIDLAKSATPLTSIDLNKALKIGDGCTWKLYKERTLETEIKNKTVYPAGAVTQFFAAIYAADGTATNVYEIRLLSGDGTDAYLIDVVMDNSRVSGPVITGNTFTYTFPADVAFVDYEVKVSSGAKYKLYKDYDQSDNDHVPFEDIGSYIPYGGYQFDVVVTSQDELEGTVYNVVFERERSATYDPSLIGGKASAKGTYSKLRNGALQFTSNQLLTKETFELIATPGATYTVYSNAKKTKVLSTSAKPKAITLKPGDNTFYVEVKDKKYTNMIPFYVRNEGKSSVAEIVGMTGLSPIINNNVINVQSGGNNINVVFITSDPYAVVEVYADAARKIEMPYTSNKVEEEPNRFTDARSFNLDITHATSKYYINCIAEDGAVNQYDLIVTKMVKANAYTDVPSEAWYTKYVTAASEDGILQGSQNGATFEFRPNANTSRQEMAVVASRLLGINATAFADVKLPFKDAKTISDWALGNVKVVYAMGVMKGSQDATGLCFRPTSDISRQETIAMFVRMLGLTGSYNLKKFKDHASVAAWAKADVEAAVASGLIEGSDGKLNPTKPITRAELAAMISRV